VRDQLDGVVPICLEDESGRIEQIGTGVLVDFRGRIFLLTAGHIIDAQEHGGLLIPSGENIISGIDGSFSYYEPKTSRAEDMMDFGYFKLDHSYAERVMELFEPIHETEIIRTDDLSKYQLFSFSGYPHRKSRSWEGKVKTEMFSYGAYLASPEEYAEYNCNITHHLVAKYDRKNCVDAHTGEKSVSPLPDGISGGGVFAWPEVIESVPPENRKLIAIGHTFKKTNKCFIATNVNVFLKTILYNNPDMRREI
jgi:hypothetical protein